jgi:hypothetical protein
LRAFTADARSSTVKFSDDIVAVGLFCDRRRRVDNREDVVDADRRAELDSMVVGDAGSIVNEGSLSAVCSGAGRGAALDFPGRSTPDGGWGSGEEELLLAVEVCEGVDAIGGADLVGAGWAGGVSVLFSAAAGGEP